MIDPVIFSFKLFSIPIILRWYGVLVMLGAVVGALIAEREIKRRGENGESIWDALIWVLPAGIIGARLWYVVNNILGGSRYYIDNPINIINIPEGGLHFFGGLLFGAIALYFFLKQNGMDIWLFLDAIAPAIFIGQALARPANFVNQELYGQPTKLPWGIPIDAQHRLPQFADLSEATRFHPTFAYEMILNILLALLLIWISRQYKDKMKPGAIFSLWLVFAGVARTFIEFFRPDQPRIGDSFVSYTMLVSVLMAVVGVVMLLVRYGKLQLAAAEGWEEEYHIKPVEKKTRTRALTPATLDEMNEEVTSKKSANAVLTSAGSKSVTKKAAPTKKIAVKPKTTKSKTTKQKTTTSKTTKPKTTKK
ncbi:MAG: prolipoprotein diacylglyceryl transferase [Anaerolineales bacterium]|nr:prolipoprotein diacylglyceryl transferase [Anaerolineales bacterium]